MSAQVTIAVPEVDWKAAGDTDARRYRDAARKLLKGYDMGGRNTRTAVAELLINVADALEGHSQDEADSIAEAARA